MLLEYLTFNNWKHESKKVEIFDNQNYSNSFKTAYLSFGYDVEKNC